MFDLPFIQIHLVVRNTYCVSDTGYVTIAIRKVVPQIIIASLFDQWFLFEGFISHWNNASRGHVHL